MKTIQKTAFAILFCFWTTSLLSNNKTTTVGKEDIVKQYNHNKSLAFIENKGQFTDSNILFKMSYGNCDIYITTEGLSYVFVKQEVEGSEIPKAKRYCNGRQKSYVRSSVLSESEKEENKKVYYYRLDMYLVGANIEKANIIKEEPGKQGHYNYFYPHCPDGIYNVQEYGKITIKNIYQGIDWVIYTTRHKEQPLKYDFVVHPQADYKDIKIKYLNAQNYSLSDEDTKLQIQTIAGKIEEGPLLTHQIKNGKEQKIATNYIISNDSTIRFEIANFDTSKTLIIDPLVWATYYGSNEVFNAITTDTQDNVYITGYSYPIYFPTQQLTGAYFQANHTCMQDAVILKFNHQGQRLWATFYGGAGEDEATSICADSQNNIYIVGVTGTEDFPTQYLAGSYNQDTLSTVSNSYRTDGFILKFNYSGQRQWATYYGGMDSERGLVICRDSQDNIYIAGNTFSWNLPVQQLTGAYWHMIDLNYYGWDLFILKFNSQGQRVWATYYGDKQVASKISICADSQDNIYIAGTTGSIYFPCQQLTNAYWQPDNILGDDAFIIKFNSQCILKWASCYGGVSDVYANSICADKQDNIYITGNTNLSYLSDFPTQYLATAYWQANSSGYEDIFILKFNNQGVRQWATYYGGSDFDIASSICADNQNNIYITGETYSSDFPVQQLVGTYNQSTSSVAPYDNDVFILKFNSQGQRLWATYYGSNGRDKGYGIAVDSQNSVYFTGNFQKSGAYTVDYGNGAFYNNGSNSDDDGFILKFIFCNVQMPNTLTTNRNNFCAGDSGSITLSASGGSGNALKWYTGSCGQTYIGSGSILTIPSPSQTTTYFARWESCDTSLTDCVSITVNVDTSTTLAPDKALCSRNNICADDNGNIKLYTSGGRGDHVKWYTGGCGQDCIGIDTLTIPSPTLSNAYYARWESSCDTSACTSVTVNVKPLPIVSLGNDAVICEGDSVALNVNSGYSSYSSYLWQDGSINNFFMVSKPGIYWLTVNYNDCFISDTIIYTLCEPPLNLWIPSAFTPNGDGLNDVFKIESVNTIQDFHLSIFNRWGQLIFESKDVNKGWDGNYKANAAEAGIYVWKLHYRWEDHLHTIKEGDQSGHITVIR